MTLQQYRALGKKYKRMEIQLEILEHGQESQVETLTLRYERAERQLKKKWAKRLDDYVKRMDVVGNQIDRYEHT